MSDSVTVRDLQAMKHDARKSVAIVAWDVHMARLADRAGVDMVSVGDTVGINLWGQTNPLAIDLDEILIVAKAVRRGVGRALVSVDLPYGPLQEGGRVAVRTAIRLAKEAGADLVKLDGASDYPEAITAIERAGIPVFAQFGITPQRALRFGLRYEAMSALDAQVPDEMTDELIAEAKRLESAGASLLDFTNSGSVVGPAVTAAVTIPVLGGFGGGPWLDGRVRMAHAAIGYAASNVDKPADTYANVAKIALDSFTTLVDDVRSGRQIRGGIPVPVS